MAESWKKGRARGSEADLAQCGALALPPPFFFFVAVGANFFQHPLCKARSSHPVTVTLRAREAVTLYRRMRHPPPPPAHEVLFTRVGERRKSGIKANDKLARLGRANDNLARSGRAPNGGKLSRKANESWPTQAARHNGGKLGRKAIKSWPARAARHKGGQMKQKANDNWAAYRTPAP